MTETPHDALAKFVFQNPEHAARELSAVLPQSLSARLDWSTLALRDGSFIDPDLGGSHSDLLFQVELSGHTTLVYVLFEHKSSSERLTALQLLGYVVRVLEAHVRQRQAQKTAGVPLPLVIPVVLHHSETGWTAPSELLPLFGPALHALPEIEPYLPNLRFVVDDISHLSDERLRGRALGAVTSVALWAMRDARTPGRILETMGHWADALIELDQAPDGGEALNVIFRYISQVSNDTELDELKETARRVAPRIEARMATIAERLRSEGRVEGLAQGRLEGEASLLERQLEQKFGALPEQVGERLRAATEEQLTRWARRVLIADSIDAVFGE